MADILVVSITAAEFVLKDPGRPYFNDEMRLKVLEALECVDYAMLSEGYTVDAIVESVEPDLYIKGEEYVREDQIPWEKMQEIISDFPDMGVKAVTFSGGGEPLVNPHIIETIDGMKKAGVETSIITNGQLLNGDRAEALKDAKWVRISCDSADAETYAKVRKIPESAYGEVYSNIENFVNIINE